MILNNSEALINDKNPHMTYLRKLRYNMDQEVDDKKNNEEKLTQQKARKSTFS